jgi:polar amino acid transport system substrate-binding protein
METRSPPWAFEPGRDVSKDDLRKPPKLSPAQLQALEGFDVEVMNALALRLGMQPKVVPTSWLSLEAGLLAGQYDVILSAWTPNPRTPPEIAASVPYCDWGLVITVRAGETSIHSPADLDGHRVGQLPDPTVARALRQMGDGHFVQGENPEKLFADLKGGSLDAVILDSFYARWKASRDPSFQVVGEPLNRLGYHVGVRSAEPELLRKVDAALGALQASGELAAIRRRWQGVRAPQGR